MTAADQLRFSCADVERVCALLVAPTPEAVDACGAVLEGAVRDLAALRPAFQTGTGDPDALAEAWRLRRTVRRAGALLANAAAYHTQWTELLGVKTAGYGPGGEPGETPHTGRFCLRG